MNDTATSAPAGGEAQPIADVKPISTIDDIINNAETEAPKEEPKADQRDAETVDDRPEEAFPKKAVNALSRRDKQIGKQRAQIEQLNAELIKYRQQTQPAPQLVSQQQGGELSPAKTGVPTKLNQNNFNNYADFIEARAEEIADYKIDKKFAERESKQQETQQSIQEQAWENERSSAVDKMAEEFSKETPELPALFDEYADVIKEYPKELKHALLAADNPPLAFFNLAKDGKLEDLASMSLVDAKVEIRLAQMKQPIKPKTKAPTPLPASRGSVPSGKSIDSMDGHELLKWVNSKG